MAETGRVSPLTPGPFVFPFSTRPVTAGWQHPGRNPRLPQQGRVLLCFLFSFWSVWFWALWLASPTLRGKAAGEESCCLPLEDGGGGEERRAKPEQLGSPVWAGGPGCPRGAHWPVRRREPGRRPMKGLHPAAWAL